MLRGKGSSGLFLVIFILYSINISIYSSKLSEGSTKRFTQYPQFILSARHPISLHDYYPHVLLVYVPCGTVLFLNSTSKSLLWSLHLKDYEESLSRNLYPDRSHSPKSDFESVFDDCQINSSIVLNPLIGEIYSYCSSEKCLNLTTLYTTHVQAIHLIINGSCENYKCFNMDFFPAPNLRSTPKDTLEAHVSKIANYETRYFYDSVSSEIELFACFDYRNTTYCFDFVWNDDGVSDYVSEIRIVTRDGDAYYRPSSMPDSFFAVSFATNTSHDVCLFHVYKNRIKILNRCSLSLILYFLKNGMMESFIQDYDADYKFCSKFIGFSPNPMSNFQLVNKFHHKSIKATRSIIAAYGKSSSINTDSIMKTELHYIFDRYSKPVLKFSWNIKSKLVEMKSIDYNCSQTIINEENIILISFLSFWKEILVAALAITIFVNIILYAIKHYVKKKTNTDYSNPSSQSSKPHTSSSEESGCIDIFTDNQSQAAMNIVSRYKNDFEHIECIGRGGFGVVFKSRNVVDDCLYAVKRIELPDCIDAREKVMREVKALAKLNHHGIIRFYNAWFEDAPEVDQYEIVSKLTSKSESSDISISPSNDYCNISSFFEDMSSESLPIEHANDNDHSDPDDIIIDFYPNANGKHDKLWDQSYYSETECTSSYASAKFQDDHDYLLDEEESSNVSECFITSCGGDNRCLHSRKVHLYIQMQLCKSKTLRSWLKKTKSSRSHIKTLDIFRQILSAIEFIHSQCLTHRDLKPSNIFFAFDGSVKIGDFGLVTRLSSRLSGSFHKLVSPLSLDDDPRLNRSTTGNRNRTDFAGTSLYMSPEQVQGLPYDSKVDIYSLGLIFFELLIPFKTEMERYKMLTQARSLQFPELLLMEYPLELNLLKWILDPDPSKRPSATQIRTSYAFQELMVRTNAVPLQLSSGCKLA